MECPNCHRYLKPGAKICIYCGYKLAETGDPRIERDAGRARGPDRPDRPARGERYDDELDDRYEPDDEYGGRRPRPEPPARGGRTQGRGRPPEWDEPLAGADDSIEAPAFDPRSRLGAGRSAADRGGGYAGGYGRPNRDLDDERDADSGYDEVPQERPQRPSSRRPDDRVERGSRPRDDRFDDPLDDPRAPGFLRGGPAPRDAGRAPSSSSRNGRGPNYDGRDGYGEPGGGRRPPSAPGRQGWQDAEGYADDPRRGGFGGRDEPRGYGAGSRVPPRRTPAPRPEPLDDSWAMPAFSSAEDNAVGWTDPSAAWAALPSEEYSAAQPGVRGSAASRNTRRPRTGAAPARGNEGQRAKLIALGVLLAALLVGGGVFVAPKLLSKGSPAATTIPSAFATYTPGPTPTPAAGYTLFTSKRSAYILTYPQDWSETEEPASSGDNLDMFVGTGGLPIFEVEQATGFAGESEQDVIDGEVQAAEKADSSASYKEDASAATTAAIGGEQWARREFDVTSKGVKYRMAILSSHHHGKGYVIVLVTAPADFAKYNSGAFKTMLSSFRFVG